MQTERDGSGVDRRAGSTIRRTSGTVAILLGTVAAVGLVATPAAGLGMDAPRVDTPQVNTPQVDTPLVVELDPIGPPRFGGDRCPAQGHWWNFRLEPTDGSFAFSEIVLDLAGTTRSFSGGELVPRGGADDVLVEVPSGHGLDELRGTGSSAVIEPAGDGDGDGVAADVPRFTLGFICYGPLAPGPTTVPGPPAPSVEGICHDVADDAPRYWHLLTNDGDADLDVTWADGSATIPANGSVHVPSGSDTITLVVAGEPVATNPAPPSEVCTGTVTVTKLIAGPERPDGDPAPRYTIQISRLVGDAFVPEAEPFQLVGGQTVEIPLPSTFAPEGVRYRIEEIDPGDADAVSITPDTFVLNGHRGETVDVRIANAFAAIRLDKSVDKSVAQPGDELVYSLAAENTGGVTLERVTIFDRLPAEVALTATEVVGGGGACTLVESDAPQLVRCDLDDALPPGGRTPTIRLTTVVDGDVPVDESIVNQAAAVGDFEGRPGIDLSRRNLSAGRDLTCLPTIGQVCDLAATASGVLEPMTVETPPTETRPTAPPTTTLISDAGATTTVPFRLPTTGSTSATMYAIGGLLVMIGGVLVLGARRPQRFTGD